MPIGNRYNGGGSLQGVVIEGQVSSDGLISTLSRQNADGTPYQPTYVLAGAPIASLAAGASVAFASNVTGGAYVFDAQFSGTSPSLQLQSLGADGATYGS